MNIQKIRLNELEDFVSSNTFLNLKNKPISLLRVASYLKNPNAKLTDIVLYMAFINNELIGYRTIWRDVFFIGNTTKSFGWLSGNWVHENFRRKGISTKLFNEAYNDWDGELMYTNYAEASKLVYDKTNQFKKITSLKGTKFYVRFSLADILPKKKRIFDKIKIIWKIIDAVGNVFVDFKSVFSRKQKEVLISKENEKFNNNHSCFFKKNNCKELFKRNEKVFEWVLEYPWIETTIKAKKEARNYNFSVYAKEFENKHFSFYNYKKELIGFVWLHIKNRHLKIPYAYITEMYLEDVANIILQKVKKGKVKTVLVYNNELEKALTQKLNFVTKKVFFQNYFATQKLVYNFPEIIFKENQLGDGDVIFA